MTDSGLVNPARVQMIMQELGKAEDSIFKDRQRNEISFKARMKNKRRRERQQESNEAPAWLPRGQFAPQALGGGRGSGPGNNNRNMFCLKNEIKNYISFLQPYPFCHQGRHFINFKESTSLQYF